MDLRDKLRQRHDSVIELQQKTGLKKVYFSIDQLSQRAKGKSRRNRSLEPSGLTSMRMTQNGEEMGTPRESFQQSTIIPEESLVTPPPSGDDSQRLKKPFRFSNLQSTFNDINKKKAKPLFKAIPPEPKELDPLSKLDFRGLIQADFDKVLGTYDPKMCENLSGFKTRAVVNEKNLMKKHRTGESGLTNSFRGDYTAEESSIPKTNFLTSQRHSTGDVEASLNSGHLTTPRDRIINIQDNINTYSALHMFEKKNQTDVRKVGFPNVKTLNRFYDKDQIAGQE